MVKPEKAPSKMPIMNRERFASLALIMLGLALAFLILPAFNARFMADDYCMNAAAQNADFGPYFKSVYSAWSGRFAYISFTYFLAKIPPQAYGVLALATLAAWAAALSAAYKAGAKLLGLRLLKREAWLLALLSLLVTFKVSPNLFQDLYWRDGLVNYIFPLIFSSLSLYFACRIALDGMTLRRALPLTLSAFLSAGFSESASIANLSFWGSLLLIFLILKSRLNKNAISAVAIAAGGSMAGFLIEFIAPGNQVRSAILPERPDFFSLVAQTLRNVAHIYGKYILHGGIWVLLALLVGIVIGRYAAMNRKEVSDSPVNWFWLAVAGAANFLLGAGVSAAVVYLMNAYPDDRIILIPYFFATLSSIAFGIFWGRTHIKATAEEQEAFLPLNRVNTDATLFLLLCLGLAAYLGFNFKTELPAMQDYAQRWDARDVLIKKELTEGKTELLIPGLESRYGLPDLQLEKDDWVNRCMADHYGAASITGK